MSYLTVSDFKAGVDRRRPVFAGEPGSIWEAINGHLTRGGDFEKRKAFVSKYVLPAGTFGLAATDSFLYTFGSATSPAGLPAGITYQRLEHPDSTPSMTQILDVELFDGLLYVIAKYSNGDIIHFYNGVVVADWLSGIVRTAMISNTGIASHLAALIQADTTYATTVATNVVTVEATVAGTPFTITTLAENVTGGTNDQTATVALTVANVAGISEVLSICTFGITGGTNSAGVNKVTSIKINGIEVLNVAVDWVTSNSVTAANVATQINTYVSAPEYSATSSGQNVTISAAAGSGATPNGFTVAIDPDGNVTVDSGAAGAVVNKTMAGGVAAVAGQKQKNTVTIGGTFEVGDRFTIIIDNKRFGADGNPRGIGTFAHTQVNKIWSPLRSIVYFSGVDLPAGWNALEDAGAGSINAATHAAGSADVTGLENFQGKLAIFSRRVVQIWNVDEDEALNSISQTLKNTGTRSPRSVVAFSDLDVFYLDSYGIRSLRTHNAFNSATSAGVGALIDSYVVPYLRTLTDTQIESVIGAIEPEDGRFWLAVGTKIFVFSYFPDTKISGWTWYEPGFQVSDFAIFNGRIYARSANTVYLYGGDANVSYDAATLAQGKVTCWIPFLSMSNKDGTYKSINGVDIGALNTWNLQLLTDPNDLNRKTQPDEMPGFTYSLDDTPEIAEVTHISPYLTCQQDGAAVLSKVTLYFDGEDES